MQWGTIRKLAHNRWVQVSAAGTGVFTWVGIVSDGYTYWGWLQANWRSLYHAVNHPWFYWMIPVLFAVLFFLGVRQVVRAEREAGQNNAIATAAAETARAQAATIEKFNASLQQATLFPTTVMNLWAIDYRVRQLHYPVLGVQNLVKNLSEALAAARKDIDQYRDQLPELKSRIRWINFRNSEEHTTKAIREARRAEGIVEFWDHGVTLPLQEPQLITPGGFEDMIQRYGEVYDQYVKERDRMVRSLTELRDLAKNAEQMIVVRLQDVARR